MAENQFPSTVDALFKGMDHFITSKTVVGEPVINKGVCACQRQSGKYCSNQDFSRSQHRNRKSCG